MSLIISIMAGLAGALGGEADDMSWQLHGTWDHGVEGNAAQVDFNGLSGVNDILVIAQDVTKSVSGTINIRCSTNNGASFFAGSSDYEALAEVGTIATGVGLGLHLTSATAARTAIGLVMLANLSGIKKPILALQRAVGSKALFFAGSLDPVNAVRIYPSAGGNFTGGKIHCLKR